MTKQVCNVVEGLRSLLVPLDSLKPNPRNAKRHDDAQIEAIGRSLSEFGQHRPFFFRSADRIVYGGNGSLEAARRLGWTHVAAIAIDEDEQRAAARGIADNRTFDLSPGYDDEVLASVLRELPPALREPAGFSALDVAELLGVPLPDDGDSDGTGDDPEDEPEDPVESPRAVRDGDLWGLGQHRLLCADSTIDHDIDRLLGGLKPALIVTDPPYAVYGSSTGVGSDVTDDKIVRPFFEQLWKRAERVLPEFAACYVFTDWRSYAAVWDAAKRSLMRIKNALVWTKNGAGLGSNYANTYELIAYGMKCPPPKNMTGQERRGIRSVLRPNVFSFNRVTGDERMHNAAKPVALLQELIRNSSDAGDLVVDLYGGSGSTLFAAELEGRRCAVMEIEPKHCDRILVRWARRDVVGAVLLEPAEGDEALAGKTYVDVLKARVRG